MTQYGLVCLLLAAMAWGQATSSTPALSTRPSAPPAGAAPFGAAQIGNAASETSTVAPDTPVITINGSCENPPSDKAADANCKTLITRAEFEKIMDAVQPNMPPRARRQLAMRYANALVMSQKAHEMGLDQGPKFEERMNLARIQVLSTALGQAVQEKAAQISDKDIDDYYHSNTAAYEEVELQRIFVPHSQMLPASKIKLSETAEQKRQKDAADVMQKEADKLHTRAVAGEDFVKLQAESYELAGLKTKPPSTKMGKERRNNLPPTQASVMDLKSGEISQVFSDQSGYYIYKVGAKEVEPLDDKLKEEIRGTIRTQRVQEQMQAVQKSSTPTLDDSYFGPEMPAAHAMPMPPGAPSQTPPSPGPK
jgi:PPIC-type PPIASE domain